MARKRVVNPCKMKGMDLGSRGSGRSYKAHDPKTGKRFQYSGCECAEGFVCSKSRDVVGRIYYTHSLIDGQLRRTNDLEDLPKLSVVAVPCDETYLRKNSYGTKIHKIHNFEKTRFKGCNDIEKWLLSENLIRYEARETLFNSADVIELTELAGRVGDYGELDDAGTMLEYSLDGSREEISYESLTRSQIDIDEWEGSYRGDERSMASIQTEAEPEYDPQEAIVSRIESLLEKLTTKQRNALKRVYLENHEMEAHPVIARRLGISEDSLRDRIRGALNKLRKFTTMSQS